MSKKDKKTKQDETVPEVETSVEQTTPDAAEEQAASQEPTLEEKVAQLEAQLEKEKKEYLFLMADFDNFRKRTIKEKGELIRNGAEKAMLALLPVVDDFERALASIEQSDDLDAVKEGVSIIYHNFVNYLKQQNVVAIESTGKDFDTDLHEAVTMFPAPSPEQQGKVIDTTTKGYMINDKVLRHAKVVVGQ